MVICVHAFAPFYLHDSDLAARIAATLRPYRGCWAHPYPTVVEPVAFYLAMRAAATGDLDESVALFEESDQVSAGFGCHDRRRAMELLDQVRQGATAIQGPVLIGQADELAARVASETDR